ncbi:hypothetical protein FPSE_09877 [Fusarium pseudograminearum CS3096]|uniref:Zn(2)-C6 fungal-type domain-containing protein n=1 Tax=Fusarium pseudograminearum (strain CS3096) TaxID=1028729 RepID=K3V8K1_FUSPC|nr:hypothetical protein FPSE_09877 [Fusarium pseudograminearum CS3096]EKJ69927.1 hypothetical protein FPSE_09877 [Fusarium pseudograminearum CS3096]KAF0636577.1 hypothetical protein FPSE5266_09877 [Fusarium pseudograminearum]
MAPQKLLRNPSRKPASSSSVSNTQRLARLSGSARKAGYVPACEPCRKRKKKCDRSRPTCIKCTERDLRCEYLDGPAAPASSVQLQRLQRLSQDPSALSELLATLPYFEALELFDLFRKMPRDTYTAAQSMNTPETSSPRSPPSWTPLAAQCPSPMHYTLVGSLLPPASSPMEQELMVRHPIAYPVLMPIAVNSLPLEALLIPRNPEGLGDRLSLNDTAHSELSDTAKKKVDISDEADDWYKSLLFLEKSHIDLLRQVDVSKWTDLPIPNEFAIRVIALYLNNDYPVLPLFNVDLFLQDLAQNRPYFCSRLLVSALFAWGCQAYTSMHPKAASWGSLFYLDAQAQWNQLDRREIVTLCNISASQLMTMASVTRGRDELAFVFHRAGVEIGRAMGLLNVDPQSQSAAAWAHGYPDWQKAASYTAWGIFNWSCVFALHYHKIEVEIPPGLLKPGDIDIALAAEDGVSVSLNESTEIFRVMCKLWTIFVVIARIYYGPDVEGFLNQTEALEYVEGTYRQLLTWADELPLRLVRQAGSSHAVFLMHTYYHAIIMDLFRPFLHRPDRASTPLRTFAAERATPQTVYHVSIRQMKRLLLSYRLEFHLEALSVIWQTGVIYVANATMRADYHNKDEMQFFLNLCVAGLEELFMSYKVFGAIAKGVMSMAIRQGSIEQTQVRRVRRRLKETEKLFVVDDSSTDETMAKWMIDLDLAVTNSVEAQGGKLAREFDEMIELHDDDE